MLRAAMHTTAPLRFEFRSCCVPRPIHRRLHAPVAAVKQQQQQQQQQQQVNLQDLSMLLLLNQNLINRTSWHLIQPADLAGAESVVNQLPLAVMVLDLQQQQQQQQAGVLYANPAARALCEACKSGSHHQSPTSDHSLPSSATTTTTSRISSSSSSGDSSQQRASTLQIPPALLEALASAQQQHALLECLSWPVSEAMAVQLAPALLCPVQAPNDELVGVALLCDRWSWSDGCLGRPGWPRLSPQELPAAADLAAAGEAVRAQADAVKQLKQQRGLTNKDPAVVEAVAELQRRKELLGELEARAAAFATGVPSMLQQALQALDSAPRG